jgi:hypothetical protein
VNRRYVLAVAAYIAIALVLIGLAAEWWRVAPTA